MEKILIEKLSCNYLKNPIGVETLKPSLSWILVSKERGQHTTAYRILVSESEDSLHKDMGELWDSGKVESDQSTFITYEGKKLKSGQKCFWKVCVWDKYGNRSQWSEIAYWEMGLLHSSDWKAKWIGDSIPAADIAKPQSAPLLRKSVNLNKKVKCARAYISGLGYYELHINGTKVGDEVLTPGVTRYDAAVLYNTYDVTDLLNNGENAIGVILGNGWYNCFTQDAWDFRYAAWRDKVKLLIQIKLCFEDGEESLIVSDESWKVSSGPIIFDGLRNGESYDARLEKVGWNEAGYDDSDWLKAVIMKPPGGVLKSQQMTPIRVTQTIKPIELKEVESGVWVYDLGQNISGWARITLKGPMGSKITLRYSERINEAGNIDVSAISEHIKSGEFQTDTYILKGEDVECWEPRFTYHGFRYIQVTGFPGTPTLENLCGRVVHTDFENYGSFSCSNELLNSIQRCSRWSTLTNYHGIPTDCPHREKNGWTGDAHLSAEQLLFNFNPMSCYSKWMEDFADVQRPSGQLPGIIPTGGWGFNWGSGPAWDSAVILIPWYLYLYCGDLDILEKMYDNMKLYVDYMTSMASENIVEFGLGDWCPPVGGASDHECPTEITDTAYYYIDTKLLSDIATLLDREEDAEKYGNLSQGIRKAFRKKFMNAETGKLIESNQTSVACALYQGLVNEEELQKVLEELVEEVEKKDNHINCGILGTKYVMHALTDLGRADIAYKIAAQKTFPSWGYWIEQGATTLWESWAGDTSRNHHMFSDISAWFYKGLAGIYPDTKHPGFKHIILRPNIVGDLQWVQASHQCMYGKIVSSWRVDGDMVSYKISIPVNCTAEVYISTSDIDSIMESNKPEVSCGSITSIGIESEGAIMKLESGDYCFTCKV
jgi:alpha-L-rhamnosidase